MLDETAKTSSGHGRMDEELSALSDNRIKFTILNLRRIASRRWVKSPNWVLVHETFGLGSTYSRALCDLHGIDPEANQ